MHDELTGQNRDEVPEQPQSRGNRCYQSSYENGERDLDGSDSSRCARERRIGVVQGHDGEWNEDDQQRNRQDDVLLSLGAPVCPPHA